MQQLADEAATDVDEALIILWDAGFTYIKGPGDLLAKGDANRVRRLLGVATRRELASPTYWQSRLGLSLAEFELLLPTLGIGNPPTDGRLTSRAIHRLGAEAKRRGRSPSEEIALSDPQAPECQDPFRWEQIGHEKALQLISADQVRAIHFAVVEDFATHSDPIDPPGVRSESLLESAVFRPQTSIHGVAKYPTVEMAAGALLHALVHDHPFHNGNKRTALVSTLVFLDENSFMLTCDEDDLFRLVLQLAQHALVTGPRHELADREVTFLAQWLCDNSRWVESGDRPLPWRRLKRILTQYGCEFEFPSRGNRINITRTLDARPTLLGRRRKRVISTQLHYVDDNRDLGKGAVHKVRQDMELDDNHGIDSRAFYDNDPASLSEFIVTYRKTLRRLARL